jgi:hypothetical protein
MRELNAYRYNKVSRLSMSDNRGNHHVENPAPR